MYQNFYLKKIYFNIFICLTLLFKKEIEKCLYLGCLIVFHLSLKNHILPKYDGSTPFLSNQLA